MASFSAHPDEFANPDPSPEYRKTLGMPFDIFKKVFKFVWMCLDFFFCHRSSTAVHSTGSSSPILTPVQTLGVGIPDTVSGSSSEPTSIPETPSDNPAPPSLFALIIGINEYASSSVFNLEGAVPDALAVKTYLEQYLGVPGSHIRLLCNGDATRSAIIQGFSNFTVDQRIQRGDPILIFYAGYGGEVDPPKGWKAGNAKVQMLIPHDFGSDIDGRVTYGIPHRTIGTLLSRIAEKCGNNITVIFDCCHSGTRTEPESGRIARVIEITNDMPSHLDLDIWSVAQGEKSGFAIVPNFLRHSVRSHILLAACAAKEPAYEDHGKGVFTTALLRLMSAVGTQNITYVNLLRRLPRCTEQNPRCEGYHRDRVLFDGKAQSRGRVLFKVEKDGDNYVMDAGTARGIDIGDEFTLYDHPEPLEKSSPLNIVVVREAHPFRSVIAPISGTSHFELQKPAFALLTKVGNLHDLPVHVAKLNELGPIFESVAEKMHRVQPDRPGIVLVEKEKAMLTIDLNPDDNRVVFNVRVLGENVPASGEWQRIPHSAELNVSKLRPILDAAAHFYWHLSRTDNNHNLQNMIRFEFTEVKLADEEYDDDLSLVIKSIGDNLNQNGIINLVTGTGLYGTRIFNNSSVPLYAALLYFNTSDLSIDLLYQPSFPDQHKLDPPLRPNASLAVGYGTGDELPFMFTLKEDQDEEFGFFKLFLSTEYVDLSDIKQPSPFVSTRSLVRTETSISTWDSILVAVALRRVEKISTVRAAG